MGAVYGPSDSGEDQSHGGGEVLSRPGVCGKDTLPPTGGPDAGSPRRSEKGMRIEFEEKVRAVALGQPVVLYIGDDVAGGGIIAE